MIYTVFIIFLLVPESTWLLNWMSFMIGNSQGKSQILMDYIALQIVILFGESNLQCQMTKYDPKEFKKL